MKSKTVEDYADAYCLTLPEYVQRDTKLILMIHRSFIKGYIKGFNDTRKDTIIVTVNNVDKYDRIINTVCQYYKLPIQKVKAKTRKREIVQARQICMYLAHRMKGMTFTSIAKPFSNSHATAIHSIKTISNLIETDKNIKQDVNNLINTIEFEL